MKYLWRSVISLNRNDTGLNLQICKSLKISVLCVTALQTNVFSMNLSDSLLESCNYLHTWSVQPCTFDKVVKRFIHMPHKITNQSQPRHAPACSTKAVLKDRMSFKAEMTFCSYYTTQGFSAWAMPAWEELWFRVGNVRKPCCWMAPKPSFWPADATLW